MSTDLQHLLDALGDPSRPINDEVLEPASDLDAEGMRAFQAAWSTWGPSRRLELLEHLGRLADENIELNFDRVNRLALTDLEARVRRRAIQNLWECEDPSLGEKLATLAGADASAEVRATAAAALGRYVYMGEVDEIDERLLRQVEDRDQGALGVSRVRLSLLRHVPVQVPPPLGRLEGLAKADEPWHVILSEAKDPDRNRRRLVWGRGSSLRSE